MLTLTVWLTFIVAGLSTDFAFGRPVVESRSEQQRIQAHLALVEELLRARDVSERLSPEFQRERLRNLDVLQAYRKRGRFPTQKNPIWMRKGFIPKRSPIRVPVFIDDSGTPCAVAHLMIESGGRELAETISRANNYIYADQITDREFSEWVAKSGLFPEELALIQPSYGVPEMDRGELAGGLALLLAAMMLLAGGRRFRK